MKCDMILAGVGGQGILSIAQIFGYAAVESGLYLKQAEVHGMSQRGGDVQSHFRISDKPIWSDLVPMGKADIIISVEPMESLRYLPWLNPETGWIVTNTNPFINIDNYPNVDELMAELKKQPRCIAIDGDGIAKEVNNARGMNMVIAGAAHFYSPQSLFGKGHVFIPLTSNTGKFLLILAVFLPASPLSCSPSVDRHAH